jgi:2-oxoglutarate ferredoxin oxidoreductase subunit beta
VLWLEDGKPLVFGAETSKGIRLDGNKPVVVEIGDKWSEDDLLVHDKSDYVIASLLANMTYLPEFPDPIGVFYNIQSPTYEDMLTEQIGHAIKKKPKASVQDLLNSGDTWTIK